MRTFPLQNEEGKLHAFEVPIMLLGRRGVVKVVSRIPGVSIIRKPKFFSWRREDEFCKFMVDGKLFVVEELFGDNSRFLVGGEPPGWCPELEIVERIFSEA